MLAHERFSCPRMRPRTLRSPPVAAEGDTPQEVPRRQRRRTWRRLLHISAAHWSMELRRTLYRHHDDVQGPRIRYPGPIRAEKVKRKLNGAASKMLATIMGRTIQEEARNPTINVVMKARDRRWSWLGHVLRMPEHRLVRQVLLNCIKPTHETLFADVPNLSIENATKMSKDGKLWSSNRPSLRSQPLSGGVAIK